MGRGPNDDPVAGERLYLKQTFAAQARARELGYYSGTVLRFGSHDGGKTGWVELEADDGTAFTVSRHHLQFTAPRGHTQKRETAPAERKPKVRKEALDPAKAEEPTLFEIAGGHRDPG